MLIFGVFIGLLKIDKFGSLIFFIFEGFYLFVFFSLWGFVIGERKGKSSKKVVIFFFFIVGINGISFLFWNLKIKYVNELNNNKKIIIGKR